MSRLRIVVGFVGVALIAAASPWTANLSWAARPARIDVDGTPVYSLPNDGSTVITRLKKGVPIAASNLPTLGFYRIRLPSGQLGWVEEDTLVLFDPDTQVADGGTADQAVLDGGVPSPAKVPRKDFDDPLDHYRRQEEGRAREADRVTDGRYRLGLNGGLALFNSSTLNQAMNVEAVATGFEFGLRFDYEVKPDLFLSFRGGYIFDGARATNKSTGKAYEFSATAVPLYGGVGYQLFRKGRFSCRLSALAGLAPITRFVQTSLDDASPNETVISGVSFGGLGALEFDFELWSWLRLSAEGGYRYLAMPSTVPSPTGNGATDLLDATTSGYPLDFSGLFFGGGLVFVF